jgi:hypothetical protein
MFRTNRLLALVAGATLAVGAYAGAAGAAPAGPADELGISPCVGNPDLPACQGGDDDPDDGPTVFDPDLEFCFSLDVEDCATEQPETPDPDPNPEPEDGSDDIPSADPADAVASAPNFTG